MPNVTIFGDSNFRGAVVVIKAKQGPNPIGLVSLVTFLILFLCGKELLILNQGAVRTQHKPRRTRASRLQKGCKKGYVCSAPKTSSVVSCTLHSQRI